MFDALDSTFRFQQTALNLLGERQEVLAANIANADTPGYQARDLDFAQQLKKSLATRQTAEQDQRNVAQPVPTSALVYRVPDQPSADANTVDMNRERAAFANNSMLYETSLSVLNTQIKNMMSVLAEE